MGIEIAKAVAEALDRGELEFIVRPGAVEGVGAIVHVMVFARTSRAAELTRPFAEYLELSDPDDVDLDSGVLDTIRATIKGGDFIVTCRGWSALMAATDAEDHEVETAARETGRGVFMIGHGTEWSNHADNRTVMAHAVGAGRASFHEGWIAVTAHGPTKKS